MTHARRTLSPLIGMECAHRHVENFSTPSLDLFVLLPSPSLEKSLPALRGGDGLCDVSPPSSQGHGLCDVSPPSSTWPASEKTTFFCISTCLSSTGLRRGRQLTLCLVSISTISLLPGDPRFSATRALPGPYFPSEFVWLTNLPIALNTCPSRSAPTPAGWPYFSFQSSHLQSLSSSHRAHSWLGPQHDPPQKGSLSWALIASPQDSLLLVFGALKDDFCLQRRLLRRFILGFKNGVSLLKLQIQKCLFFFRFLCSAYKSYYSI